MVYKTKDYHHSRRQRSTLVLGSSWSTLYLSSILKCVPLVYTKHVREYSYIKHKTDYYCKWKTCTLLFTTSVLVFVFCIRIPNTFWFEATASRQEAVVQPDISHAHGQLRCGHAVDWPGRPAVSRSTRTRARRPAAASRGLSAHPVQRSSLSGVGVLYFARRQSNSVWCAMIASGVAFDRNLTDARTRQAIHMVPRGGPWGKGFGGGHH